MIVHDDDDDNGSEIIAAATTAAAAIAAAKLHEPFRGGGMDEYDMVQNLRLAPLLPERLIRVWL